MKIFNPLLSGDDIPLCNTSVVASKVCYRNSCRFRGVFNVASAFGLMGGSSAVVVVVAGRWLRTLSGLYSTTPAFHHDALIFCTVYASRHASARNLQKRVRVTPVRVFLRCSATAFLYASCNGAKRHTTSGWGRCVECPG